MSTIKAPFWGLHANKTLAKTIVFAKTKNRKYVKRHAVPSDPKTPAQLFVRNIWKDLAQIWKVINYTSYDRLAWGLAAKFENPSACGRNMFFKYGFLAYKTGPFFPPFNVEVAPFGFPFDVDCQAPPGSSCTLCILRGPNAGYTNTQLADPGGNVQFIAPFRSPDSFFRIYVEIGPRSGYSGYYPLDENWWL